MNIDGGTLSFTSELDNSKMNRAIDESISRVKGLTDAGVTGGENMAQAYAQASQEIRSRMQDVMNMLEIHENEISKLSQQYKEYGQRASEAFMAGRDEEYRALTEQQNKIQGEIRVREQLIRELQEQSNVLEENAQQVEKSTQAANESANAHQSMRARIRELKETLVEMEATGQRGTAEYEKMRTEVAALTDAWGDAQAQANILANDQAGFKGVLSGLTGLTGGFTAVSSAVGLFADENEDLQKAMLKVQQLMAITMGLQQVSEALNKDSAFRLVTLNGLKEWWNNLLLVGTGAQTAETAAQQANIAVTNAQTAAKAGNSAATITNTAAQTAQTTAAVAGTAANITLAGAFRMVGAAIKSIPVFGWIAAGISAIIAVIAHFSSEAKKAKKEAEEFGNAVAESCYQPIGAVETLSAKWNALGDDFKAKEKFIIENQQEFEKLGVKINGVTDAENLLISNKENFIQAQIAKAKSMAYYDKVLESTKELIKAEETLAKAPKNYESVDGTYTDGYGNKKKGKVLQKNEDWAAAEKAVQKAQADVEKYTNIMVGLEQDAANILTNSSISATQTYAEGSLGAIEQAIALETAALKELTSNEDYEKSMKKIADLQAQADKITGKKSTGGGGSTKDAFKEKLDKMKSEYARFQKWMNSGDDILIKSAKQEFDGILKQGATYIDYLKNQRDTILSIDVAERTNAQNKQLRTLNDAISEETKKSVLEAFNDELNSQLTNAKTIIEQLNIIEKMRKELTGDGTELDNEKAETLNNAEEETKKQAEQEMTTLLENYAGYVEKKRRMEEEFNNDIAMMQRARLAATTDEERSAIDAAIENRKTKYNKDSKSGGDDDYADLLENYKNFEQGKQAIIDDFAAKRKIAEQHGNKEMVEELNRAEKEALSKFAIEAIQASPDWSAIFGNLDELGTSKIKKLIKDIESLGGAYLGVELDPKDLQVLMERLDAMKNEMVERNPFGALVKGMKEYSTATDKESRKKALSQSMKAGAAACDMLSQGLSSTGEMMVALGVDADSEAMNILGSLGSIADGASQVMQGIMTGNPMAVFDGVTSIVTTLANAFSGDNKREKYIKRWQAAIDDLANAYKQLSWEIDNALGDSYYQTSQAAINNMKQQKAYLEKMWQAEGEKKKSDSGKIKEYKEQYAELERQIQDAYAEIAKDITQTDASSFAQQLADSLSDAFKSGEDAAKAFSEVVNNVLQNAIVNQLKRKFLENQLQGALNDLENSMGYWDGENFVFDGLTDSEIASFRSNVSAATNNFTEALQIYKDIFKDLDDTDADTSLSGAVKGVSEETADILAGQINAIRINQLDANTTLRNSLLQLNTIAMNTEYCKHLSKIDRVISLLESASSNTLRSQGLS